MPGLTHPFTFLLLSVLLVLLLLGWHLCWRLRRQHARMRRLRQRNASAQRAARAALGQMRGELQGLAGLADQVSLFSAECDTALQQQQGTLEQVAAALQRIKVESQQLTEDARQVGSEARQSLQLAARGQAGLSATLMALRSVDRALVAMPAAALGQEVRVLARQGRDQTYDANLALAGVGAAASGIEERGLSLVVACEAQALGIEVLDAALEDARQLVLTSAWRSRQARAASEALQAGTQRLDARMRDLQQDAGDEKHAVQDPVAALPGLAGQPAPHTAEH
ncbi:methyl-accepting chemotaxis protein [Pseudomonas japonica]|uniref:Uncharacterized protein n=1 Tax=Pseudomonas japonica TaxID=256466 RepID=A0A239EPR8_9PSED|nr:methyl-accepting chemotaxis protein [Pseudomonas japonica]SNS46666.1 hypothetical protein SAMN05444352_108112 [Pseudomonas japonica]